MRFSSPLLPGRLIRRYKRFFADVLLDSGEEIVALTPNTGSMKGVCIPGNQVLVSDHRNSDRKVKFGWELIKIDGKWVGINTHIPNVISREALDANLIPVFRKYTERKAEVYIASDTRMDFRLSTPRGKVCWLEVKNVTLVENGVAKFPDSVSLRGTKHLEHLIKAAERGEGAAMLYAVQNPHGEVFSPADEIDPVYGETLRRAVKAGVKIEVWKASVTPKEIRLAEKIRAKL